MAKVFTSIYWYFKKHPLVFFVMFLLSFVLAGYFALQVKFEEDISKILPKDKKTDQLNRVFTNSKFIDKLVVMVSLKDSNAPAQPDSLVAFAGELVINIQTQVGAYITKINHKADDSLALELFGTITEHLPIYLNEQDYDAIDSLVTPAKLRETLEQNFRTLTSPAGFALKNMISNDPVGISFLGLKKLQQLQYDENFELYDSYVVTKDHRHLLMFIQPAYPPNNTGQNALLLEGLDKIIDSLGVTRFKSTTAAYFGASAVSVGNALQLRKDSLLTQGITVVFIIVFLGLYFRKKLAPFIILIPVLFGALFSLAAVYFIKGSISVIALGTGSVILGIAVNYSLHLFNHYRHTKNMEQVIADLAFPLTIGSLTTIGGFLCLEFVESEMLKDLGLFAAFSLMGASLSSLIFLPQLIASKKEQQLHVARQLSWIDKIAAYRPEYNRYIVLVILVFTVIFAYTARKVNFESDLERMNFMPGKLKKAEHELNTINEYALKSVYLVTEGKTLDEALLRNEKIIAQVEQLREQGIVKKYSGVSSLIISGSLQQQRINRWNNYWTIEKKEQLFRLLEKEGMALGFKASAFDNFKTLLSKKFQVVDAGQMTAIRKNFLDDYITEKPGESTVVTLVKCAAESRPLVYGAFENHPAVTVVDKQYLTAKFVSIINSDFARIALMTSVLVFLVLLITYGRIELTFVSFIPMLISWVWILGIMGMFGISFNIINIIVSALIFGLGDDYSLFIMDGLLREYKTGRKNLSSYKSSIFLSAITTIAGLGVLIFAQHPALRSIALISIIGIVSVVLMSQILIPFLFTLLIKNRVQKKLFPWTLTGLLRSTFAFCYFVLGALLLTILGLLMAKLNPFNKEKGKLFFHVILSKVCWSLMYIMANVKKEIINPQKENFSQPAVIICNHQSFLDILSMVMLHPKLILFTNNWVWNSPVFGAVVRMADYFPVEQGVESSIDLVAGRIKQGYSVVIFPEGTRSADGNIKRFHKGAFYLAEKLNLDILPILIHGSGYTMTKGDFLLKNGKITVEFLPRIKPRDEQFGTGYSARAKGIGRYYREEYKKAVSRIEQPAYFRGRLIYNYLYKGPELEWYMKVKLSLEKNYQLYHELLPKEGKLLDIGCGYGFMSYLLYFAANKRVITGIDYDEEKIKTAGHCFDKTENTDFHFADALQYPFEQYDGIILSDMLHYLQPAEQIQLLEKCIRHLQPNGTILIREANADMEKRHTGTKVTEFFSTRFFGFNKTSGKGLSFLPGNLVRETASRFNIGYSEIDQSKFTSNILYLLKKDSGIC
ncbi:MAG: 1-acyl-sn-glycerol-3-phosphate acyltransferase [Ferruginibacter sp.]|nr:1-acyl-sn-glycerol-3-phosphate acyltransferase [Ferruginibacter sp.]